MHPIKADFDSATEQPWSPRTCLIIKCAIRHGIRADVNTPFTEAFHEMSGLRHEFDMIFAASQPNVAKLKAFRAKLPTRD